MKEYGLELVNERKGNVFSICSIKEKNWKKKYS